MKKIFVIFSSMIAFCLCACSEGQEPKEEWKAPDYAEGEYEAMMEIYEALHLDKSDYYNGRVNFWGSKINWRWNGVTREYDPETSKYYVTKLKLENLPYASDAYLPDVFDRFSRLEELCINGEYIINDEEIPGKYETVTLLKFPASICECRLDALKFNAFKGIAPSNFSNLANTLEYLCIYNTEVGNELLAALDGFTKLKEAYLMHNGFTGKIPFLGQCSVTIFDNNDFTEFNWEYLKSRDTLMRLPSLLGNGNLQGPWKMTAEEIHLKDYTYDELSSVLYERLSMGLDYPPFYCDWIEFSKLNPSWRQ